MGQIPPIIHKSWHPFLSDAFDYPELIKLNTEILPSQHFYPERQSIFSVFQMPLDKIKVVILGQDPYPNFAQATGLAFAVNKHIRMPKSLEIIEREIHAEYQDKDRLTFRPSDPREWKTLIHWFHQGVFLLNTALTVEANKAGSHLAYWSNFTEKVVHTIASENSPVWLLWGTHARKYRKTIEKAEVFLVNDILEASHPASESYTGGKGGFYGCNHFLEVNKILEAKGQQAINW